MEVRVPGRRTRFLVVTLHDVAPPFEAEIRAQLELLAGNGVDRCVLKVVPNWHGKHPIGESPSLVACLQAAVESGSEVVLHGFDHRASGPLRGSLPDRVRGSLFAPGVAEFLTLSPDAMYRAVLDGLALLADAGLPRPSGFCAPGWLLNREARGVLRRAGMQYVLNMFSVEDLATGDHLRTPAIGYMGAGGAHEWGIRVLNGMVMNTWAHRADVVKVYLHPQGSLDRPSMQRVLRTAQQLAHERSVTTFASVMRGAGAQVVSAS